MVRANLLPGDVAISSSSTVEPVVASLSVVAGGSGILGGFSARAAPDRLRENEIARGAEGREDIRIQ
jgi:hypothetical protein